MRASDQGRGIGALLVAAAIDLITAAADIGNRGFSQRQGFRMSSMERDASTPAAGYLVGIRIDGIELRDRV